MKNSNSRLQFILIWSGQCISMLTSSVMQMAIVWYLTQKTGSAAVLTISTLCGYLPQAICGIFIGALIDRYNKKRILILSDLFISSLGLVLFVVGLFGDIPIWVIFVVLILRSIGTAFYMPSLNAVMPLIIKREELTNFAGYSQGFKSISMLLSPAIAAALFSIFNLNVIVLIDTFGALIAVMFIGFTAIPKPPRNDEKHDLLAEVKLGFRVLHMKQGLTALLIISALYAIIYFPIGTLFPHIAINYFGGSVAQSSAIEILYAVGMLLGSLTLGIIGGKINKALSLSLSMALYGTGILLIGSLPASAIYFFYGFAFMIGISTPFFMGIQTAVYQIKIEEQYLGRVLSLNSSITMLAMPIGLSMAGVFADKIGVNNWYFYSGIATLLLAIVSRCLPSLRHICDD